MGKLGGAVATLLGVGVLMIGFRPAWDAMYETMNVTGLSNIESIIWKFAPIAIVLGAIVGGVLVLARRRDNQREDGETRW